MQCLHSFSNLSKLNHFPRNGPYQIQKLYIYIIFSNIINKNIFNTSKCNSTTTWINLPFGFNQHPTPVATKTRRVPQLEESLELEWEPPLAGPQAVDQVGHFSGSWLPTNSCFPKKGNSVTPLITKFFRGLVFFFWWFVFLCSYHLEGFLYTSKNVPSNCGISVIGFQFNTLNLNHGRDGRVGWNRLFQCFRKIVCENV